MPRVPRLPLRRLLPALGAAVVLSFTMATGAFAASLTMAVSPVPVSAGSSETATLTNLPQGTTSAELFVLGTSSLIPISDQNCSGPSGGQIVCSFSLSPTEIASAKITSGSEITLQGQVFGQYEELGACDRVVQLNVPVNEMPEVPYAALAPLMMLGGALWFRRRRAGLT